MSFTADMNGAHHEPSPLRILVTGAGIGGLCAAIGLRQQGHQVSVYEQSRLAQESGAAIHLAPNCSGLLQRLGLDPRAHGAVELMGITEYEQSGELTRALDISRTNRAMWQHPWYLIHRAHLHTALKELATSSDGEGTPVQLHLNSPVESVHPDLASITLSDGREIQGALIIGADGVHSRARKAIPGGDLKPYGSGKSAYRFLIPTAEIAADGRTRKFLEREGHLVMWMGGDRRLVMYPCVGGTQMNFVAIHPSAESTVTDDGDAWQQSGHKAKMLQIYEAFGEGVAALLSKAEDPKIWTLLDMQQMPHFVYQKLAVIGDAAHPFLPHQAQGGAQAIEDALCLAALLPLGTTPEELEDRLAIFESQRYERSHTIQRFTRLSGEDVAKGQHVDIVRFTAYNVGYDEWHSSKATLQNHLASSRPDTKWRTPVGFGPAPGPRQPLGFPLDSHELSLIRAQTEETMSTLILRFRSSRTLLETLLPPGFCFASPATICEATMLVNTLDGMTWLGGGGYNFFWLQLHGIKYTKRDGEELYGSFLPLLFEDLTDPIMTGRDDLGMPKVYSAIDVTHEGDRATVKISWRGSEFGTLSFSGLSTEKPQSLQPTTNGTHSPPSGPSPPAEMGQFAWRYVPAVGEPGKADAEYPVFISNGDPSKVGRDPEVRIARDASFEFEGKDWQTLPTLHNIARVLADVPNYGIVAAKHVKSKGADDLLRTCRIE